MIIEVDEEGASVIKQLCDVYLKTFGMDAYENVRKILNSVKVIKDETIETPEKDTG